MICCTNDKLAFSITVFGITVQPQRWKILRGGSFVRVSRTTSRIHIKRTMRLSSLIFLSYSSEYAERGLDEFLFRGVAFYFMTETEVQKTILFPSDLVQRRVTRNSEFSLELDIRYILERYVETLYVSWFMLIFTISILSDIGYLVTEASVILSWGITDIIVQQRLEYN